MGLDIVELILDIEETFTLRIPDRDAEQIRTVGDLIDYLWTRVQVSKPVVCLSSQMFYRLRREMRQLLPLPRHVIRPEMKFDELVPKKGRRQIWRSLRRSGLQLPDLRRSRLVFSITTALVLLSILMLALWSNECLTLVAFAPLGLIGVLVSRPLAVHIPDQFSTIRKMIMHQLPAHPGGNPIAPLTRKEIADKVCLLVSQTLGVNLDEVKEESSFVEDLGAG